MLFRSVPAEQGVYDKQHKDHKYGDQEGKRIGSDQRGDRKQQEQTRHQRALDRKQNTFLLAAEKSLAY